MNLITYDNNGPTIAYTYRADGLRHSSTINGVRTYYVWKNGHIVLELNASKAVANRLYRCVTGRLIRSSRDGFFLHNARGDVIQRTDASGNVIARYEYDAFGVQRNATNSQNRFRFAGEQFCTHTERYNLRNRDYSPRLGRFSQPDPHWHTGNMIFGDNPVSRNGRYMPNPHAILQAGNLYVFTMNNPVMFIDPTGLFAQAVWQGFVSFVQSIPTAVGGFGSATAEAVPLFVSAVPDAARGMERALGPVGSIAIGMTPAGTAIAIALFDVYDNVTNWDSSLGHAGTTALNVISAINLFGN